MAAPRAHGLLLLLCGCCLPGCASVFGHNDDSVATDGNRPLLALKHHERGLRLVKHGKLDRAEVAFQEAIIADKGFGPAHNNLGRIQFERRDLHSAAWSFQRAIELMPERAEPLNNLGLTYEAAGKHGEAIEMFMAALERAPDNPEFLGNLIRARLKGGEPDDSLEYDLERLLAIDSRPDWVGWAELKLVLLRRQRPKQPDEELDLTPTPAPARAQPDNAPAPAVVPSYQGELPPPAAQNEPALQLPRQMIEVR
jgi:tetratricopeptide (TPR) repeat protein